MTMRRWRRIRAPARIRGGWERRKKRAAGGDNGGRVRGRRCFSGASEPVKSEGRRQEQPGRNVFDAVATGFSNGDVSGRHGGGAGGGVESGD